MKVVRGDLSFETIYRTYLDVSFGRSSPTVFACPELFDKIKAMICELEKKYGRVFSPDIQVIAFSDSFIVRDCALLEGQMVFKSLSHPERSIRLIIES